MVVKEKEELKEELKKSRELLGSDYDYVESLLEMETLSLDKDTVIEERIARLRRIPIYKSISNFNIYTDAISILSNDNRLKIFNDDKYRLQAFYSTPLNSEANTLYGISVFTYNSDNDYLTLQEVNIDPELRKQYLDMLNEKYNSTKILTEKQELEKDISMIKQRENNLEEAMRVKSITDEYTKIFMEHYNINESDFKEGILQPTYTFNGGNYLSVSEIRIEKRKYWKEKSYY